MAMESFLSRAGKVRRAPNAAMALRHLLLVPCSCRWNVIVRDVTAKLESGFAAKPFSGQTGPDNTVPLG